MSSKYYTSKLIKAPTKSSIPEYLHPIIISACTESLAKRNCFIIALSGGSLPSFLSSLSSSFASRNIDPQFTKWHVCLADERIVESTSDDCNLKSLKENFLKDVPIPHDQIYGIDEPFTMYKDDDESCRSSKIAHWYETNVISLLLLKSNVKLDCAILGFGPDGHTCSLFPNHALLSETQKLVAHIDDSPKPPPSRITLTLPVLNHHCRYVIFCGAGESKKPILKEIFGTVKRMEGEENTWEVEMVDPAPYPCGMVQSEVGKVVWVVDDDAAGFVE